MEQKTILLLNVVAIQFISICSDYWISIKFRTTPPPNCRLYHSSQMARLDCGNISYTLAHQHANLFRQCNDISDFVAFMLSVIAPIYALFGYLFSKDAKGVIRALSVSAFASVFPVLITMFIIHSTNTREPKNEEQFLYYTEADWSLFCAALGCLLMGLTTHVCMVEHRHSVERQLSQHRRRQLHNALMSSCRQDIAMAIRARMTVI